MRRDLSKIILMCKYQKYGDKLLVTIDDKEVILVDENSVDYLSPPKEGVWNIGKLRLNIDSKFPKGVYASVFDNFSCQKEKIYIPFKNIDGLNDYSMD